jgi:hypothetical protein
MNDPINDVDPDGLVVKRMITTVEAWGMKYCGKYPSLCLAVMGAGMSMNGEGGYLPVRPAFISPAARMCGAGARPSSPTFIPETQALGRRLTALVEPLPMRTTTSSWQLWMRDPQKNVTPALLRDIIRDFTDLSKRMTDAGIPNADTVLLRRLNWDNDLVTGAFARGARAILHDGYVHFLF